VPAPVPVAARSLIGSKQTASPSGPVLASIFMPRLTLPAAVKVDDFDLERIEAGELLGMTQAAS
jgi:hypothetical protein